MSKPRYWTCPNCGAINELKSPKCQCGYTSSLPEKNHKQDPGSAYYAQLKKDRLLFLYHILCVVICIMTIVLFYTRLTAIVADYCVEKRIQTLTDKEQWSARHIGLYAVPGLDGYRLVVDSICYVLIPVLTLFWCAFVLVEHGQPLESTILYVTFIGGSLLIARFVTIKRFLIIGGISFIAWCIYRARQPYDGPIEEPDDKKDQHEELQERSPEEKLILFFGVSELIKHITGHDDDFE